jgi:hypothetical protein
MQPESRVGGSVPHLLIYSLCGDVSALGNDGCRFAVLITEPIQRCNGQFRADVVSLSKLSDSCQNYLSNLTVDFERDEPADPVVDLCDDDSITQVTTHIFDPGCPHFVALLIVKVRV